jgi:MFS family permease
MALTANGNASPRSVIRTYLVIAGLYTLSASLIWGVNTLFLLEAGLTIFEVFIANAVFSASMAVFEIPTGVLADTGGRRLSFLLSVVIVGVGTLGYVGISAVDGGLLLFCAMSVVLGLGYTFYSGAVEAWLVDALNATGYEGELDRVFARSAMVSGAAMLIGSVGGGLLGNVDLSLPFLGRALLLGAVFGVALFTMFDLGFKRRSVRAGEVPAEMIKVARAGVTFGWQRPSVRLLVLVSFLQAGFMFWGFYAWQPYFLELLGREAVWVAGVVSALIALATMAGNSVVEWFTRTCGKRTTLLFWAVAIQTLAIAGVGLAGSFWLAVGLFLVVMACVGAMGPVKQAYLNQIIPSEQRATVISFDSLVGSIGGMAGQGGLGYLSQVRSIGSGYLASGLITVLGLPLLLALRAQNEEADLVVDKLGKQGTCACQGLPEVTAVDSVSRRELAGEAA